MTTLAKKSEHNLISWCLMNKRSISDSATNVKLNNAVACSWCLKAHFFINWTNWSKTVEARKFYTSFINSYTIILTSYFWITSIGKRIWPKLSCKSFRKVWKMWSRTELTIQNLKQCYYFHVRKKSFLNLRIRSYLGSSWWT